MFGGEVYYTFRHFPNLSQPQALLMALAAEAARRQDQYWAMHELLFTHTTPVSLNSIVSLATGLGLDAELFLNDMRDEGLTQRIWRDMEQGRLMGIVSTPTLFLGTHRLHGKLTQARLVPLIRHYVCRSSGKVSSAVNSEYEWI